MSISATLKIFYAIFRKINFTSFKLVIVDNRDLKSSMLYLFIGRVKINDMILTYNI